MEVVRGLLEKIHEHSRQDKEEDVESSNPSSENAWMSGLQMQMLCPPLLKEVVVL